MKIKKLLTVALFILLVFAQVPAYAGLKGVSSGPASTITAVPVPINQGGTGTTTASGALSAFMNGVSNYVNAGFNYILQTSGGALIAEQYFKLGGAASFNDWMLANTGSLPTDFSDQTDNVHKFLADCQIKGLQLGTQSFDDVQYHKKINCVIERGQYQLNSPEVVYTGTTLWSFASFTRENAGSQAGNCTTNFWDGNTTIASCNMFAGNKEIPMFLVPQGAEIGTLSVYAQNQSGGNNGSGVGFGRAWEAGSCSLGSIGSGYTNGDIVTTVMPDKFGAGVQAVLTVSGGNVTGCSLRSGTRWNKQNGVMPLPFAQRKSQWSNATFIAKTGVTTFDSGFGDGSTAYLTTGGTGTGLSISFKEFPDWCSGSSGTDFVSCTLSTQWEGLFSQTINQSANYQRRIHVFGAGLVTDASFGPMYGVVVASQNNTFEDFYIQGGYFGAYNTANGTDNRWLNDYIYASEFGYVTAGANNQVSLLSIDTPVITAVDIQKGSGTLQAKLFTNNNGAATTGNSFVMGDGAVLIGPYSVSITSESTGAGSGAFASFDYLGSGNDINLVVNNNGNFTSTNFATFGSHSTANTSTIIRGTIDNVSASNFCLNSSNAAGINMNVWDSVDVEYIIGGCAPETQKSPSLNWVSGSYYTNPFGSYGTVNSYATVSQAGFTAYPIYIPAGQHLSGAGMYVHTNATTSTTGWHVCIYPDLGHGKPDTQALLFDLGGGTVGIGATGSQTTTTFNTGSTSTPIPQGWYWLFLEFQFNATATPVLVATNNGSGSWPTLVGQLGAAAPFDSASLTTNQGYSGNSNTYGACPATPSTAGSLSLVNTEIPTVWLKR
jgi:hypothetical protein